MMPALQYLRHGKALCGKVFKRFVETFNFHNDFIANLKGDGDLPGSDGCMNVDTTDPKHPVIRLNKNKLPKHGDRDAIPGRFEISITANDPEEGHEEDPPTYTANFSNTYYDVGGMTFEIKGDDEDEGRVCLTIDADCLIAIKISARSSTASAELVKVASLQELNTRQEDTDYYTIPLYLISAGSVSCDFRTGPVAAMGEALS